MQLGEPNIWHIFSPRYLPEINTAAAEAEKPNETVGGSMGLGSNNCHSKLVKDGGAYLAPRISAWSLKAYTLSLTNYLPK